MRACVIQRPAAGTFVVPIANGLRITSLPCLFLVSLPLPYSKVIMFAGCSVGKVLLHLPRGSDVPFPLSYSAERKERGERTDGGWMRRHYSIVQYQGRNVNT
jgi:hypothetical protein